MIIAREKQCTKLEHKWKIYKIIFKFSNSTGDLATRFPLKWTCVLCVGEKEIYRQIKCFRSFFVWSSVCVVPVKKKKIVTAEHVQQTGEHLHEHNQHELRGTHFTSWIHLHYVMWNYWAAVREKIKHDQYSCRGTYWGPIIKHTWQIEMAVWKGDKQSSTDKSETPWPYIQHEH